MRCAATFLIIGLLFLIGALIATVLLVRGVEDRAAASAFIGTAEQLATVIREDMKAHFLGALLR